MRKLSFTEVKKVAQDYMVNKCWSEDGKPKVLTIMLYGFSLFESCNKIFLVLVHVYLQGLG